MVQLVNSKYDVIVVGAGPGGSTTAALLARRGLRVLLLDKNERAGGRMFEADPDSISNAYLSISAEQ